LDGFVFGGEGLADTPLGFQIAVFASTEFASQMSDNLTISTKLE
jgi:hypothetical protein